MKDIIKYNKYIYIKKKWKICNFGFKKHNFQKSIYEQKPLADLNSGSVLYQTDALTTEL